MITKCFETLLSVSDKLASKEFSSTELCESQLERIRLFDPVFGAYSDVLPKSAMAEARASDQRRATDNTLGSLDGVPIAIKDLIDTSPAVCSAGLEHLSEYRPKVDSSVTRALREAGAVIMGVTETDPGAFSTRTGLVINPLAPDRIVGGSSGGSAAAVAAGMAFGAIGTDTGGSIRIPAACCSISGFKPTWGRVDVTGIRPLARSLDHVGPLARCVSDLMILQSVLDLNMRPIQNRGLLSPLTIGIDDGYFSDAEYSVKAALALIFDALGRGGVNTRRVSLPNPDDVMAFHMVNLPKEAAAYHTKYFPNDWRFYPELARLTVDAGSRTTSWDYDSAQELRDQARNVVDSIFDTVDAIILPTLPVDAPLRHATEFDLDGKTRSVLEATVRYTSLFNQTGNPVVSIPGYINLDGRAVCIQIVGRRDSDELLLEIALRIERILSVKVDYETMIDQHLTDAKLTRLNIG